VEDEPLRRHLLTGRIETVDEQGVRLRPFAHPDAAAADVHRLAHRAGGGRRGQAPALPEQLPLAGGVVARVATAMPR
jgi:hypothetical protein